MKRTVKLTATALFGLSLTLTAAACGSEEEAPQTARPDSSASVVAPPSDRSVPVVPGPSPKSATSSATTTTTADEAGDSCGSTKGPDGALQIRLVEGDVTCDTAKSVAKEYGPLIATGKAQSVNGWDCGPSHTEGELARCTKGSQAFALTPN